MTDLLYVVVAGLAIGFVLYMLGNISIVEFGIAFIWSTTVFIYFSHKQRERES